MNTEKLNHLLDDLKAMIDMVQDKKADDITKNDINQIASRYRHLYQDLKAQLAFMGQTWTVLLKDKNGFLTSVPGKFLTGDEAEHMAKVALAEQEEGVEALLYCDGIHIRTI